MLAFAAWSQRESLQECAEQVQANVSSSISDATTPSTVTPTTAAPSTDDARRHHVASDTDTTCTFFGVDVTIP